MSLKFNREHRLRRSMEFLLVKKHGRSISGKYLVLAFLKQNGQNDLRFGFITTRRVSNKAVRRNRIRRRLKEISRNALPDLKRGFWLVCIARSHALDATYSELKQEWYRLAKKSGLLDTSKNSFL